MPVPTVTVLKKKIWLQISFRETNHGISPLTSWSRRRICVTRQALLALCNPSHKSGRHVQLASICCPAAAASAAQSIQQSIPESAALSDNVTLLNSTKQATFLKINLILYNMWTWNRALSLRKDTRQGFTCWLRNSHRSHVLLSRSTPRTRSDQSVKGGCCERSIWSDLHNWYWEWEAL